MKRKLPLTALITVFITFSTSAQFKAITSHLPVTNSVKGDIQKVVADFPYHFQNIRGEMLDKGPQSIEYASTLKVGDLKQCSIMQYSSGTKYIYSWQAMMLINEDFETAAKKYKSLYQQLKGSNVYYVKDQYTLKGDYDAADESKGFATSTLALADPPAPLKKLRIDINLQFEFPEWKVSLVVYEKEREDDEQGDVFGD
ncbi:hypothetical protein OCK74_26895 [Chitinophagaceae bacterium LB-8]|uniref:DUF4390 domain-containing protein n=1 Tax=Paraflavisolibacter caeni TaxID=2982496 RepID=A0A9X2Y140_9BACT|nr:hypothetical protein [Paraflavisolibacter caeni]MCU7552775.1 hypothetical protein [Paraflavisolibacter caeni]